jgi:adenine-specific DNA-methyltransferase
LIRGEASQALHSLAHLRPYRRSIRGAVKLVYIDPPFNTGEDFDHYADSHSTATWLSLLRDHLCRVRDLLAPDGSVWVHLDDSEQHRARCVLDEVFGTESFVATIIWQKRTSRDNRTAFSVSHDYIHVYAPMGPVAWKKHRNALPDTGSFANRDNDPRGPWRSVPMTAQAGHATAAQFYTVVSPTGDRHEPPPGRCWTYSEQRFQELVLDGRVYWPRSGRGKPRLKHYQSESRGLTPSTIWTAEEVGENADAKKSLMARFAGVSAFDTPKPEALLERIIHIATDPGDLVLDYLLGSGTTAVVAEKMNRRWIGVEQNEATVETFVLPRLKEVLDEERQLRGQGGFSVLDVAPSMYRPGPSVDGFRLSNWAENGQLAEAVAAQLDYPFNPEGPFVGRRGRFRLAVVHGTASSRMAKVLAKRLGPGEVLHLVAEMIDPSTQIEALSSLPKGSQLQSIGSGLAP